MVPLSPTAVDRLEDGAAVAHRVAGGGVGGKENRPQMLGSARSLSYPGGATVDGLEDGAAFTYRVAGHGIGRETDAVYVLGAWCGLGSPRATRVDGRQDCAPSSADVAGHLINRKIDREVLLGGRRRLLRPSRRPCRVGRKRKCQNQSEQHAAPPPPVGPQPQGRLSAKRTRPSARRHRPETACPTAPRKLGPVESHGPARSSPTAGGRCHPS